MVSGRVGIPPRPSEIIPAFGGSSEDLFRKMRNRGDGTLILPEIIDVATSARAK
jgi:hypothetical protein